MEFIILTAILLLLFILFFAFLYIIFRMTFYPLRSYSGVPKRLPASVYGKDIEKRVYELVDEVKKIDFEEVSIHSYDGLTLYGNYYKGEKDDVIQLCFHGYRGNHFRDFSGGSKILRDNKMGHILVHQRSHGKSDGNAITFGIKERRDVLSWIGYTKQRFGNNVKIVLAGVSMGCATVLMASDMDLPENVVGIIADCGYTSPKEIIKKVTRDKGLSDSFFYPFIKLSARIFACVNIEEASPIKAVKNTNIPILFIHGSGDDFVPYDMTAELYDACSSNIKRFVTIDGAGHAVAYIKDKKKYTAAVLDFYKETGIKK